MFVNFIILSFRTGIAAMNESFITETASENEDEIEEDLPLLDNHDDSQ